MENAEELSCSLKRLTAKQLRTWFSVVVTGLKAPGGMPGTFGVFWRRYSASGGVCVRHCNTLFMKHELPKLLYPGPTIRTWLHVMGMSSWRVRSLCGGCRAVPLAWSLGPAWSELFVRSSVELWIKIRGSRGETNRVGARQN